MNTVTGVFVSRRDAENAVRKLRQSGIPREQVALLFPGDTHEHGSVAFDAGEQPGMGKAIGAVVGAATGVAGGLELGALVSAAIPGVGSVVALGILGAALLGAAGAAVGGAAGKTLENVSSEGLPEDELFVYEDALRRGRSVVFARLDDEAATQAARDLLAREHAETVDAAREQWWIGLRSAEQEHYAAAGRDFSRDEKFYRLGFEAALHARSRCKEYDQVLSEMAEDLDELKQRYPGVDLEEPFRRGYQRGRDYYQHLCGGAGVSGL